MVPGATTLRVTLRIDGGFACLPGLAQPIVLDAAQLDAGDAAALRGLCDAAFEAARTNVADGTAPIPDGRRYRATIEAGDARHEITAADPIADPAVAALIAFIEAHGRR